MNKTAIKNFAIWARNKLIADITYKSSLMGITADGIKKPLPQSTVDTQLFDIGTKDPYAITGKEIHQRRRLVNLINQKSASSDYKTTYQSVIEEVAYTWFNRLIAIRFMEVNDYLPSHIRVLSSDSPDKLEPDIVTDPFDTDLEFTSVEESRIIALKNENKVDELFQLLFIKQCNALNECLPMLFEKTEDYTELLLNVSVTDHEGVVYHLIHDIPEDNFNVNALDEDGNPIGQVEIIGWLYQYYNTEPKDDAFAKKGKISKEEIPAVTQLFTPDWIVRYMVENSVGRIWIEHLRANDPSVDEKTTAERFGWKYYLSEAKQEPDVQAKLDEIYDTRKDLKPEDITCLDPAMGSGHILVYMFEVLMQIYKSAGYAERGAAISILEHNIYGLDIDDRAFQLSYFALIMKARQYNRTILRKKQNVHIYAIQESNGITSVQLNGLGTNLSEIQRSSILQQVKQLVTIFYDAKEYGSILNVPEMDWDLLRKYAEPDPNNMTLFNWNDDTSDRLFKLISQGQVMANKYLTICTNPPYCGTKDVDSKLSAFVKKHYPLTKADTSTVFMETCADRSKEYGFWSMINIPIWVNKESFENYRRQLLNNREIINLLDFDRGIFGSDFGTVAFTIFNKHITNYYGKYLSLFDERGKINSSDIKQQMFFSRKREYAVNQDEFFYIPSAKLSYSFSNNIIKCIKSLPKVGEVSDVRSGLQTGNNDLFLRLWFEVDINKIGFEITSRNDKRYRKFKWFPHTKGGSYRKWYGNFDYIVNWENDGYSIKHYEGTGIAKNQQYYFEPCITWSHTSMRGFSARMVPKGFIFNVEAPSAFRCDCQEELIAFLNSNFTDYYFRAAGSSLHYLAGTVDRMPCFIEKDDYIKSLVKDCVSISHSDWMERETSFEFSRCPIASKNNLSDSIDEYIRQTTLRFERLRTNEIEINNRLFSRLKINEISSEVKSEDVTVLVPSKVYLIKELISYAVGCMFGRYSLDVDGLAYAGGEWDSSKYSTFIPDEDNVIPITDEEYFDDDIVGLFIAWLKKVYGEDTLEENLAFIAKALGGKGKTSREVIRNYFLNDFFKDHCQTYSVTGSGKRPIYWLFSSGKQNGFKALIYMHRYNPDTIGKVRVDYLHRMEQIYTNEITRMQDVVDHSNSAHDVSVAEKRIEKLRKQVKECQDYDAKLGHLALDRIAIDLDDGVKINYQKVQTGSDGIFYEVLADSKQIMAKDELWKQYLKEWHK